MKLPLLISVPHSGILVPTEVVSRCLLSPAEIHDDSDGGGGEIYHELKEHTEGFISTDIARAIVDLNRAADDFRRDGVIKTHTCYNVPVYKKFPDTHLIEILLKKYYRPYHLKLAELTKKDFILGIDCHTMAEYGPPVGPDPGQKRPLACLSNAGSTCPESWLLSLAACLTETFQKKVTLNTPFKGGYIIRQHSKKLPWVQLELSRTKDISNTKKKKAVLEALRLWYANLPK